MKRIIGLGAGALLTLTLTLVAQAQDTGAIVGKVSERGGGPIANATCRLQPGGQAQKTKANGSYTFTGVKPGSYAVRCSAPGFRTETKRGITVSAGGTATANFTLANTPPPEPEPAPVAEAEEKAEEAPRRRPRRPMKKRKSMARPMSPAPAGGAVRIRANRIAISADMAPPEHNTEQYDERKDNDFQSPTVAPLSTFSIDVDTASYANMRRFLNQSRMPPKDAIKIEELINYFTYDYEGPDRDAADPFAVHTEVSQAPWAPEHQLVKIGIQGKKLPMEALPPSNLVFLFDVSGSMNSPNKLPLLKAAFKLLVNNLRPNDRVAIVVYASASGLVLPSTGGKERGKILEAIERLRAGGSTAGGAGIKLAYKVAKENFIKGGNNRVILATDGDFNVGASSDGELVRMIEEKRKEGVFLTVLGFGSGNYKDAKMEKLADKGNGNHAYIDSILEAKKVLVSEMGGTLFTIAKDVKIQVEFNPAKVKAYRLIGYVNRLLKAQDFNDDKKDAGELGAGHTVTALYEIIPAGSKEEVAGVDELKYQQREVTGGGSDELMTVKLRYKQPDGDTSKLLTRPVKAAVTPFAKASNDFKWAATVAAFGMQMRDSKHKGGTDWKKVTSWAKEALGKDTEGYRYEFTRLIEKAKLLASTQN